MYVHVIYITPLHLFYIHSLDHLLNIITLFQCVDSYNCFFRGTPEMKEKARPTLEAGLKWLDQKFGELGKPFFSG